MVSQIVPRLKDPHSIQRSDVSCSKSIKYRLIGEILYDLRRHCNDLDHSGILY